MSKKENITRKRKNLVKIPKSFIYKGLKKVIDSLGNMEIKLSNISYRLNKINDMNLPSHIEKLQENTLRVNSMLLDLKGVVSMTRVNFRVDKS